MPDPTLDNIFKLMLGTKKKIAKNFLNTVLYPISKKIIQLKYISANFPGRYITRFHNSKGSKILDLPCECSLEDDITKKIIIDLEMQIGSKNSLTERFIDYALELRLKNEFKKTWVIALVLRKNKKSSTSDLTTVSNIKKMNSKNVIIETYDNIQIMEIDLNACFESIKKGEELLLTMGKN